MQLPSNGTGFPDPSGFPEIPWDALPPTFCSPLFKGVSLTRILEAWRRLESTPQQRPRPEPPPSYVRIRYVARHDGYDDTGDPAFEIVP
ncbi:MAG: hypothetical protein ACE5F1_16965 [Planctomycetota bacterium]